MDSQGVRIVVACALGAMAGLIVALRVPEMIWWVGAVLGGTVSGGIYSFRKIVRYSPQAVRFAWSTLTYLPDLVRQSSLIERWEAGCLLMQICSVLIWAFSMTFSVNPMDPIKTGFILWGIYIAVSVILCAAINHDFVFEVCTTEPQAIRMVKRITLFSSPIGPLVLVVWGIVLIPKALMILLPLVGEGLKFLITFTRTLLVLIHSRGLVLCFIDGALGVMFSYLVFYQWLGFDPGPTITLGGLVGALFGAVHYEIISKRVLYLSA